MVSHRPPVVNSQHREQRLRRRLDKSAALWSMGAGSIAGVAGIAPMYFDRRLWQFTEGLRLRIAGAVLIGLLSAAVGIARLALLGWLLGRVFQGEGLDDLILPIVAVAAAMLARGALEYWRNMEAHRTAASVQLQIRARLFDQIAALGPGQFGGQRSGEVLLGVIDGVEQLETYFGQYLPQLFVAAVTPFGIFAFAAFLDLPLAGVLLGFALLTLVAPVAFHHWDQKSAKARQVAYAAYGAELLDSVQGLATLKAFGQSAARGRFLAEKAHDLFRTTMWVLASNSASRGITDAGIAVGAAAALGVGAARVAEGAIGIEVLLIVLMMGVEVFRPMRDLRALLHTGMHGRSAAESLFRLLDTKPAIEDADDADDTAGLAPTIAFEDVRFAYPGGRRPAHDGLSFSVSAGERVGIVGASGAGKSTVLRLLMRFDDPQAGRILLGGQDLRTLDRAALRAGFGVVNQDTYLFHGTAAENIRFGKPDASDAEVEAAARAANAHGFIARLSQGYDTVIGERGIRLSGGQRQRIAIARALLRDAPILLLDEALSSVDAENEAVIQDALARLMGGRTVLVMAHRLSSVIDADRILVLDEGRVVESGRHQEILMASARRLSPADDRPGAGGACRPTARRAGRGAGARTHDRGPPSCGDRTRRSRRRGAAGAGPRLVERLDAAAPPGEALPRAREPCLRARRRARGGLHRYRRAERARRRRHQTGHPGGRAPDRALCDRPPRRPAALARIVGRPRHGLPPAHRNTDRALRQARQARAGLPPAPAHRRHRRHGDAGRGAGRVFLRAHRGAGARRGAGAGGGDGDAAGLRLADGGGARALHPAGGAEPLPPAQAPRQTGRARQGDAGPAQRPCGGHDPGAHGAARLRPAGGAAQGLPRLRKRPSPVRLPYYRDLTFQMALIETATGLGGLAVVMAGTAWIAAGSLEAAMLPLLAILAMATFLPVSEIAHVGRQLADTLGATRRLHAVHSAPVPVQDGPGADPAPGAAALEMTGVGFTYVGTRRQALADVTLTVRPGETLALVGPSGAGKTTIAHLFMRFWDPEDGVVRLDGEDVRRWTLDALRARIALVAQDTYLFNDTLRANILIARPDASEAELAEAVRRAALEDFVAALPEGLETRVGERGTQLSGGQRQRVAVARAFLKNAPILILDEATSHLDAVNEALLRRALSELMAERTTVVIAHRLSTVRDADTIVVLADGRIVETGTHETLLARAGLYAQLVTRQLGATAGERKAAG